MKKTYLVIMCLAWVILPVRYSFAEGLDIVTLDSLIDEATDNNPQIQAAYNNWQAAIYKVRQAKSLPDPMASYTYFGESIETRNGPQEEKYGVSQKIPFPGKLGLKAKAQSKRAGMFEEKYKAAKREVIRNLKFVYYDIFWVDRAIAITEEEKSILENLEKVAQRKYESNLTPQQDVIKAQVELSKLIDKLFMLRQNRKSLEAKINSILDRSRGMSLGRTDIPEPEEFAYELNQLHTISQEQSQDLLAANLDVERAKYEKSLAKMDFLPDFTVGFDYTEIGAGTTARADDGKDAWSTKIAVNVPIWFGRLGAQLKEKNASLIASKKNHENVENTIEYEVEDLYFKITTYKDIVLLYKTALIPQTEQAFEAARTGYESGKVDFLNWLDAERVLLQTRLAYYKAVVDYEKSVAYLEQVVGADLSNEDAIYGTQ